MLDETNCFDADLVEERNWVARADVKECGDHAAQICANLHNAVHACDLAKCRKLPRYVPYKGTYVPYDGTYGVPDQGQMLDVWESQTTESALRNDWPWIVPRHTLEIVLEVLLNICAQD